MVIKRPELLYTVEGWSGICPRLAMIRRSIRDYIKKEEKMSIDDFNEACELLLELHNSDLTEEKVAQFLAKHGYLKNPLDDPRWITTLR